MEQARHRPFRRINRVGAVVIRRDKNPDVGIARGPSGGNGAGDILRQEPCHDQIVIVLVKRRYGIEEPDLPVGEVEIGIARFGHTVVWKRIDTRTDRLAESERSMAGLVDIELGADDLRARGQRRQIKGKKRGSRPFGWARR